MKITKPSVDYHLILVKSCPTTSVFEEQNQKENDSTSILCILILKSQTFDIIISFIVLILKAFL